MPIKETRKSLKYWVALVSPLYYLADHFVSLQSITYSNNRRTHRCVYFTYRDAMSCGGIRRVPPLIWQYVRQQIMWGADYKHSLNFLDVDQEIPTT